MGTAFDRLAATIIADPNVASDALYGAGGGVQDGVPIRCLLRRPDIVSQFGESRFASTTILIEVKVADAPDLAKGDWFKIGAETWTVRTDPRRDPERLFWLAEVKAG